MSAFEVLSDRHALFVREYCIDRNGARAYRAAYPRSSEAAARVSASKLLAKANIRDAISEYQQPTLDELGITFTRIIRELARCCFFNVTDALEVTGAFKPLADWPEELLASVHSMEMSDPDPVSGMCIPVKVRFVDRVRCLELMMRFAGILDGQRPSSQLNSLAQLLAEMGPSMFAPVVDDPDFVETSHTHDLGTRAPKPELAPWIAVKPRR